MRKTNSSNSLRVLLNQSSSTFSLSSNRSKQAAALAAIDFDATFLENFVSQTLSEHVEAGPVYSNLKDQAQSLYQHASKQNFRLCNHQQQKTCSLCAPSHLAEIALSLDSVVQMTPSLPAAVTAEVHSLLGLLSQKQGNLKTAIQSYLKALWIQTASSNTDEYDMALTRHRLGLAYGKSGNFTEATTLLQKALDDYEESSVSSYNDNTGALMEEAQKALTRFQEASDIQADLTAAKTMIVRPATPTTPTGDDSSTGGTPTNKRVSRRSRRAAQRTSSGSSSAAAQQRIPRSSSGRSLTNMLMRSSTDSSIDVNPKSNGVKVTRSFTSLAGLGGGSSRAARREEMTNNGTKNAVW